MVDHHALLLVEARVAHRWKPPDGLGELAEDFVCFGLVHLHFLVELAEEGAEQLEVLYLVDEGLVFLEELVAERQFEA